MKTIVIDSLIAHIEQFNQKHPDLSLSSLCILAKWNSSSHARALRSRNQAYLTGGTYNPGRLIQEAIEADDFEKALDLLEQFTAFRVEATYLLSLENEPEASETLEASETVETVEAELAATSPEIDSLPNLEDYVVDSADENGEADLTDEDEEVLASLDELSEEEADSYESDEEYDDDLVVA